MRSPARKRCIADVSCGIASRLITGVNGRSALVVVALDFVVGGITIGTRNAMPANVQSGRRAGELRQNWVLAQTPAAMSGIEPLQ